jgi:hypothetical protein
MSVSATEIIDSVVLTGSQFNEPMRVLGKPTVGDGFVLVNSVADARGSELPARHQLSFAEVFSSFGFDGDRQ